MCLVKPPKPQMPVAPAKDQAPDGGAISEAMRRRVTDRTRASQTNLTGGMAPTTAAAGATAGKTLLGQ